MALLHQRFGATEDNDHKVIPGDLSTLRVPALESRDASKFTYLGRVPIDRWFPEPVATDQMAG